MFLMIIMIMKIYKSEGVDNGGLMQLMLTIVYLLGFFFITGCNFMAVELIIISAHFSDACCKADPDRFPCDCGGFVCYNEAVLGIDILIISHL